MIIIGLISDTHDNLPMVEKTVRTLNQENVAPVLHAGDYVAPFVIPKFKALEAKPIGVFGNNDGDHETLKVYFPLFHILFGFSARVQPIFAKLHIKND